MDTIQNVKGRTPAQYFALIIFIVVVILAVILRIRTLYDFCFIFADSDQYVLWAASNDIHHGLFHEPCFYGQAYNPLFEPLLAQPLLFAGFSLRMALPIVSGILGFLPYILLGWACFRGKMYFSAIFAMVLLIWLPVEFQVITSIPRGYLPACAFASVGASLALFSKSKTRFFWFGFLSSIGFFTSQNCIFMVLPVAVYLLLNHYRERKFYFQIIAGVLLALPLPVYISWFYHVHPSYNKHYWELDFSFNTFKEGIIHADKYFNFLSPYAGYKFLTLIFIFILSGAACLVKRHLKAAISIFSGLLFLLFSLYFDKFHDGTYNLFYSGVRMYLGLPISFIIFCFWAESALKSRSENKNYGTILICALLFLGIFTFIRRNQVFTQKLYSYPGKPDMVIAERISISQQYCEKMASLCKEYNSGLVIYDNWRQTMGINYMCAAMNYPFKTLIPYGDRRAWALEEENRTDRENFIYLPEDTNKIKELQGNGIAMKQVSNSPVAWLVETNGMKVFDILKDKFAAQRKK